MKITYNENEKRHILESETGHMSTFLKERVTREQAETLRHSQIIHDDSGKKWYVTIILCPA